MKQRLLFVLFITVCSLQSVTGSTAILTPMGLESDVMALDAIDTRVFPALDMDAVNAGDALRERAGLAPRFAVPNSVDIHVWDHGTWEVLDNGFQLWRLKIDAKEASSLNFGFTQYSLPADAAFIYSADGKKVWGPYTEMDNAEHGQFYVSNRSG